MKARVIAGILCVFLSFAVSLAGFLYVRASCDELERACASALAADTDEKTFAACESLLKKWETRRELFGALLKHTDADELARAFLLLETALENRDAGAARVILANTEALIRVIFFGERPDFENIF